MSDYSCNKHGHDFHEDCAACEAADDWASMERRIAELEEAAQAVVELKGDASYHSPHELVAAIDALAALMEERGDE